LFLARKLAASSSYTRKQERRDLAASGEGPKGNLPSPEPALRVLPVYAFDDTRPAALDV
jgi:hypothetical protein